jgi:hypothetical protein
VDECLLSEAAAREKEEEEEEEEEEDCAVFTSLYNTTQFITY